MNLAIPIDAVAEVGRVEIESVAIVVNDTPDGRHAQREGIERLRLERDGTGEDGSAEGIGHLGERLTASGERDFTARRRSGGCPRSPLAAG
jgi:hypothetical protein